MRDDDVPGERVAHGGGRRGSATSGRASSAAGRVSSSPTVADVAKKAGVSRQTVSNVLNAPHRVRAETRRRVERAIIALGYQPNRVAQALRRSASRLIGYRIEPVHRESLANIHDRFMHALAEASREIDYHLLTFTADDPDDEVATCARLLRSGTVDGFVLYGLEHDDPRPAQLLELGAPFVAFGRSDDHSGYAWVDVDNVAGTVAAVDHLVERGHRRIGFLGWPSGTPAGDHRAEGWRSALAKHGLLGECQALDVRAVDSIANGARLCASLLDRDDPPTAVVAASDTLAAGAWQAITARGLAVGRDVAVVGFDDTPTARALDLSSVRQPIDEVGRAVLRALVDQLPGTPASPEPKPPENGTTTTPAQLLLTPTLVVRASSAPDPATHTP